MKILNLGLYDEKYAKPLNISQVDAIANNFQNFVDNNPLYINLYNFIDEQNFEGRINFKKSSKLYYFTIRIHTPFKIKRAVFNNKYSNKPVLLDGISHLSTMLYGRAKIILFDVTNISGSNNQILGPSPRSNRKHLN